MQNQNQFSQKPELGQVDLALDTNTVSAEADGALVAGSPVKLVDSAGNVPKVVACDADSDGVLGFVNYNPKNAAWAKGQPVEISIGGNCIYLRAVGAIERGAQVVLDVSETGGVSMPTGDGATFVGWAYDKAEDGELVRIILDTPSFKTDTPVDPCAAVNAFLANLLAQDETAFCDFIVNNGSTSASAAAAVCGTYGPDCPDCETTVTDFFDGNNDNGWSASGTCGL